MKNEAKIVKMQGTSLVASFLCAGMLIGLAILRDYSPERVTMTMLTLMLVGYAAAKVMYYIAFYKEECMKLHHEQAWRFFMVVFASTVTAAIILPFMKESAKAGVTFIAVGLGTAILLFVLIYLALSSART